MRFRPIAILAFFVFGLAPLANAAVTIDRTFGYDNGRVRVVQREGYTHVDLAGAALETRAGRPELPWVAERVDLPPGMRVTAVEVTGIRTRTIATGALLAPALVPTAGLGPEERSRPDARYFSAAAAQPEQVVALGMQGGLRGRSVAYLQVAPTQWDPRTGAVNLVTSVSVRLTLDTDPEPPVARERIVRDWEDADGLPTGVPSRALGNLLTTASPHRGRALPFRATQLPSVLGSPVAYVIVTSDAMAPAFQQLADWKTRSGVPAVVRTVSFIQQQYPSAADDAERIRLFLRDAYARWGTKWVLLGGDTDVIPARLGATTFYGGEMIATDLYYSCLDGNWNANGDSLYGQGTYGLRPGDAADLLPEVYVGRAPVTTPTEAQVFVNKTLQYECTPLGTYENRWLFFAEVLFPKGWQPGQTPSQDGGDLAEQMLPLTDLLPQLHIARLYENYTDPRWRAGVLPETRAAVLDSLNAGYGLGLHIGHGYRNVMEVGDASLTNADAVALANGNRLINLYAINCTSSAIDFPCIGEAFILNPNGGAVTNVGSTRFDFPSSGQLYQYEYFRLFFHDSVTAVGELNARQKLPFVPYSNYDGVDRWTQMTLLLLGDPELHLLRGLPRTLAVTAPASIALRDTQFTVHVEYRGSPMENARVTAYRAGNDFSSVTTDASGDAILSFRPDAVGSLSLVVTALDARPWQSTVAITPAAAAVLTEGAVTVVDNGSNGTQGDGNSSLDAGETVDLLVPIENHGGTAATGVTGTLTTTDPLVTFVTADVGYGTVAPGTSTPAASPASGFRFSLPYDAGDQREVPFELVLTDNSGGSWRQRFQVVVHSAELRSYSHGESETVGNGNGRPEPGETVDYTIALRNNGTGIAHGVTLVVRSYDGLGAITDSTSSYGDIAPGATVTGDAVQFQPSSAAAVLTAIVSDSYGVRSTQTIDLSYPPTPAALLATGQATGVSLTWAHVALPDLFGYNVYRSSSALGPFTQVTTVPTDRTSYYTDAGLTPLTRYYYKVTAVDSSGNESLPSLVANTSTNPPRHGIFPVPMGRNTPSSVALEHIWSNTQMDIVAGSELLYVFHADGTAPADADGSSATLGDFAPRGSYFAAGPSAAVLDPAQGWSIIGASWDSAGVYVFDKTGKVRTGWPLLTNAPVWSSVACGDLDGDGRMELAFASNGPNFYVMHANGTELMDGDSNPATLGVFKTFSAYDNYGTPALADIDGDGRPEIIYGARDGNLYAWNADGTNVPGFPYHTAAGITCSVAVGFLDGPGDTTPEIVFANLNDSLFVVEPNGQTRAGWPQWARAYGNTKIPSPALADMNNDGITDIVFQSPNGNIYFYGANGSWLPGFGAMRYSKMTSGASESSPVVADLNGDGFNDVLCGDEAGQLTAISGADGSVLPGFPIQLGAEVRGAAAVADIDHDGMTEIVVSGWDKNLYVWDYNFPFQPHGVAPWPQFHHDARRTGFSGAPLYVGAVDDGPLAGGAVASLEFASPSPNPAHGGTRMWFGIPATQVGQSFELAIYDLGGRRVRLVESGIAPAGRFSLQWDLRDASRKPVQGGVYFARFTVGGQSLTRKLVVLD
jgi:hypothetical protein